MKGTDSSASKSVTDKRKTDFAYTRAGHFSKNSEGRIVLATDQGRALDPPIDIPEGASQIDVKSDGTVYASFSGSQSEEQIGQIQVFRFINPAGLKQIGETLFGQSTASGDAESGQPNENGFGKVSNGALEGSNVDPVRELISLIETQRAFELNSQSIQAADETLRTIGQLSQLLIEPTPVGSSLVLPVSGTRYESHSDYCTSCLCTCCCLGFPGVR